MFCPRCGIENLENGKFCRGCGSNISNVLTVLNGEIVKADDANDKNDYPELSSKGISSLILGLGFILISIFVKSMPGDTYYWLLFMLPAILLIASGVRNIVKSEALKNEKKVHVFVHNGLPESQNNKTLPPVQTEYVSPNSKIKTNDLHIISVTEETTKQLK